MPVIKYVYMQNFMFVGVLVIEILEEEAEEEEKEEHGKTVKYHITSITQVLQDFADFFSISLVINISLMLVEVKLNGI